MKKTFLLTGLLFCNFFYACSDNDSTDTEKIAVKAEFKNHSKTPSFVSTFPDFSKINIYTLISSEDTIKNSPNFVYGGAPDGAGFIKNPNGDGYIFVTNHENAYAISRLYLDNKLNIKSGEYLLNTDGGMFRLCSGSMSTPQEHGFGPIFLSTGESNVNAMTHAIDPIGTPKPADQSRVKPALGKFSGENSVPLSKNAYPGKTCIILGEDNKDGQVYLYMSETVGDLDNGKLYVLRRTNLDPIETHLSKGSGSYPIEFVEVVNAKNLNGADIENLNTELKSLQLARVEDLDYRKGSAKHNREIYFTATGYAGALPDKTYMGRVYRLKLNENTPLSGTLEVVEDGDLVPGDEIINPDNVCVTENYVYIQEDGDSYYPEAKHDSYIWQYNITTGTKKKFITMNNSKTEFKSTKYVPSSYKNINKFGFWEFGAMIDISNTIGIPGTFILNIHPHSWEEGDKFSNPSKATVATSYKSGGQTVILTNVPL